MTRRVPRHALTGTLRRVFAPGRHRVWVIATLGLAAVIITGAVIALILGAPVSTVLLVGAVAHVPMVLSIPMVVVLLGADRSATVAQVEARAKLERHMLARRAPDHTTDRGVPASRPAPVDSPTVVVPAPRAPVYRAPALQVVPRPAVTAESAGRSGSTVVPAPRRAG